MATVPLPVVTTCSPRMMRHYHGTHPCISMNVTSEPTTLPWSDVPAALTSSSVSRWSRDAGRPVAVLYTYATGGAEWSSQLHTLHLHTGT
jgi:hypothetical protein